MLKKRLLSLALILCILFSMSFAAASSIADVKESHWAYKYVSYMVAGNIMPVEAGYFYPDFLTTRGEFVYYLWRTAESPSIWVSSPTFKDVPASHEFYYAIEWAVHHNITTGTSATSFSPDLALNREQAFTFLWRSLPFFGYSTEGLTGRYINGMKDASTVSSWAWQAMNELFALGIVTGTDNGYLMPLRDVANAETAAILYRTLEMADALDPSNMDGNYVIEFTIYNESPYEIYSVNVMPAYTDGGGIDLLPLILEPGESYDVRLTGSFEYADSDLWHMYITDEDGYSNYEYDTFYPRTLLYVDIIWDDDYGEYYLDFQY